MKKLTPWDILFKLPGRKHLFSEEEVKESGLDVYLLIQFLASNGVGVHIAAYLPKYHKMRFYDMYMFAYYMLPIQIGNIKWAKREKKTQDEVVDMFQDWYGCGREVAEKYLEISSKEEIQKIKDMTTVGGFIKSKKGN